ncbi:MAG: formimidoylglutamate deiminase [Roseinatronobacter sp.]|nr:formimidoylglutamate deiminase [Roseinatronobacter sp.]
MQITNEYTLWAREALLPDGWAQDVRIDLGADGRIARVQPDSAPVGHVLATVLPAPINLHSHAFQRAMAGLTEARGPDPRDTFWTWRRLMFRFLDHLTPEDCQAIAAMVQMESLEAGFAAMVEFHYLHHQPGGQPYDNPAEMAARICAAAEETGIGLTLLPVLYRYGGCDKRALAPGQQRFGNALDQFARLVNASEQAVAALGADAGLGIAPHSLRAVQQEDLRACIALAQGRVLHMHLAEQEAEVAEVQASLGARPVEWMLENAPLSAQWCFIHCTQMTPDETAALARAGAIAGLCPVTEASLGDGIFDGARFLASGGRFGIGSDSNIRISVLEELRALEYSQRLRDRGRAILATAERSTGRVLWQGACDGGAQAAGRASGQIAPGLWADLVALEGTHPDLQARTGDATLDTLVFCADNRAIADVWAAGRHVVTAGQHIRRKKIVADYSRVLHRLRAIV